MLSGWSSSVFDTDAPVLFRLTEHPGNEIDVDLREAEQARKRVGSADLRRAMRTSVEFQDFVAEVLDAEAQDA